jgi:sporulation protein YlmC with PRC-barrel domain
MLKQFLTTSAVVLALAAPAWGQSSTTSPGGSMGSPQTPSATDRSGTAAPSTGAASSGMSRSGGDAAEATEKMKPDHVRASQMIGKDVFGADDKDIGSVADLIVDKEGKIQQIVLSVGGFLGIGDKQIAVPMDQVKVGQDERLTVGMTRDQLEQAPRFEYAERQREGMPRAGSSTAPVGGAPATSPGTGTSAPPPSQTR